MISIIVANLFAIYSDNVFYYLSVDWYFWSFLGIVFAKWDRVVEERRRAEARLRVVSDYGGSVLPGEKEHGMWEPNRIAYLINKYPAVSHSFIRREIQSSGTARLGGAPFCYARLVMPICPIRMT